MMLRKAFGLMAVVALTVPAVSQASIARIKALGSMKLDSESAYYYDDARNIFLNPAEINNYADQLFFEWGSDGNLNTALFESHTTLDQDSSPKAQGGFLMRHGNYVYGAYLGNELVTSSFLRVASSSEAAIVGVKSTGATNTGSMPSVTNQVDLFFGSETAGGTQWGINLIHSDSKDEDEATKNDSKALATRLGVKRGNWEAYALVSLANEANNRTAVNPALFAGTETVNDKFDGSLGLHIGGSYDLNDHTFYGYYKTFKWDQVDDFDYDTNRAALTGATFDTLCTNLGLATGCATGGQEGTTEGEFSTIVVGWGKVTEMSPANRLYTNLFVMKEEVELKFEETAEINRTRVPLTIGFESDATNWLTLRGSVTQQLLGKKDNKNYAGVNTGARLLLSQSFGGEGKGTIANTTDINAGASLNFGDITIDGYIGTDNNNNSGTSGLSLDTLLSRVGVTYVF